jgi:hypothetical protein
MVYYGSFVKDPLVCHLVPFVGPKGLKRKEDVMLFKSEVRTQEEVCKQLREKKNYSQRCG